MRRADDGRLGTHRRQAGAGLLATLALLGAAGVAHAADYAPLNRPGPSLSVGKAQLDASLRCRPGLRDARVTPVLLNPAVGLTPEANYGWNWEPALDLLGIPWCAYSAPDHGLAHVAVSGEHLVHAIRAMHAMAGRRIAVLGHSLGGMSIRWALRFWPDTRAMVDDVVGIAANNHGTTSGADCSSGCSAAGWQLQHESPFVQALNSRAETMAGISYTQIYTRLDEVVRPNSRPGDCSTCLSTGRGEIMNVATQELCPGDISEHVLTGTADPVAHALAVDALTHPGPADPARALAADRRLCGRLLMPGVTLTAAPAVAHLVSSLPYLIGVEAGALAGALTGTKTYRADPPLPCYVRVTCGATDALHVAITRVRRTARRQMTLRAAVTVDVDGVVSPVPGARVRLGGARASTDDSGRATVSWGFAGPGRRRVSATAPGYLEGHATIRVPRRRRR